MSDDKSKRINEVVDKMLLNIGLDAKARQDENPRPSLAEQVRRQKLADERRLARRIEALTWLCTFCGSTVEPQTYEAAGRPVVVKTEKCDCPESEAARLQAEAEAEAEARDKYLARLDWNNFNFYHPQLVAAHDKISAWYRDPAGRALLLAGNPGCGKTHLARCVARAFLHDGRFLSEPDLLDRVKSGYETGHDSAIRQARQAKMLIIDDVGASHVKSESLTWYREIFWKIFERRIEDELPTLLTSNFSISELSERLGRRAFSRLQGMMVSPESYIDLFDVPDYRVRNWSSP